MYLMLSFESHPQGTDPRSDNVHGNPDLKDDRDVVHTAQNILFLF